MNIIIEKATITGNRGFTVAEVLVALVVFSIGGLALGAMMTHSIDGNSRANVLTESASTVSAQIEIMKRRNFDNVIFTQPQGITPLGDYWVDWVVTDDIPLPATTYKQVPNTTVSRVINVRVYSDANGINQILNYNYILTQAY